MADSHQLQLASTIMVLRTERPQNVNDQFLEFARHGYVADVDTASRSRIARLSIAALSASVALIGGGATLIVISMQGTNNTVGAVIGSVLATVGTLLLIAAVRRLYVLATSTAAVTLRPGAVIPSELVKTGNWINRDGAWMRIDEVGPDYTGQISALLSSGDVIYLDSSVTIAGDDFRSTQDPVSGLTR